MSRAAVVAAVCLAGVLVQPSAGDADSAIPYSGPFLAEIRSEFFEVEKGSETDPSAPVRLDRVKLEDYRSRIRRKLDFISDQVFRFERIERGRSKKKARKRAASRDSVIALSFVLELLDQIEEIEGESDPARQHRLAADAIAVEYATRSYAEPISVITIPTHLWNIVFDWSMPNSQRASKADLEAGNLVNPETGRFYTPRELADLIRQGVDLSLLDPPSETAFWREVEDIGSVDVTENYLGGSIPVMRGAPAIFPPYDGAVMDFDGLHLTQSKPKLDATWQTPECRALPKKQRKACTASYKLKFGMETHADPTANSLLATMGYNADLAMHVKNLRVELGDFPYADLEKQWSAYFDLQRMHTLFPIDTVLLPGERGRGRDESGEYVVFQEAVVEYKPSDIERIGFWPFSEGVASSSREARGLQLFNIWIANADMKDEENNKLSLRNDGGEWQMYLTQQDIGHSLGLVLPERVDVFPWEAFESSWWSRLFGAVRGRHEINYINLQQSGLEWIATYADSRWMARRIAQFTRAQIAEAVALGRWPGGIGDLYVEKLISRRNQMVRIFDLEDEYGLIPFDRKLTTSDGSIVDGEVEVGYFPEESPIRFDHHHADVFGPVLEMMGDMGAALVQVGVGSVDEIDPGTFKLGSTLRIAPELIFKLSRRVYPNPEPRSRWDQHVVQDTLRLGFRLGIGKVGFAQGGWSQALSLAYPVPTRRAGLHAQSRLLPLMMWKDVKDGDLPDGYVVARERTWHVGARVRSSEDIEVTVGADMSHDRVFSSRTVVDHRGDAPVVYHDEPRYWNTRARAYARLGVLDVSFVKANRRRGRTHGTAWQLDPGRLDTLSSVIAEDDGPSTIFERIVRRGDLDEIERVADGPAIELDARTHRADAWLGLFIASIEGDWRQDEFVESRPTGEPLHHEWQYERRRRSTWNVLGNGELQRIESLAWLGADREDPDAEGIRLRLHVDDLNTHSDELDRYYALLQGIAPGRGLLADGFVASDWEVSGEPDGRWTRMKTSAGLHLGGEALRALCALEESAVEQGLASSLGMAPAAVVRARARLTQPDLKRRLVERRRLMPRAGSSIRRAHRLLGAWHRACARDDREARLRGQASVLFETTRMTGGTFDPVVLGALMSAVDVEGLAERGAFLLEARLHKAVEDEHNLPERRDIVGRLGKRSARIEPTDYHMFPRGGVEQWKQLDWVRDAVERR